MLASSSLNRPLPAWLIGLLLAIPVILLGPFNLEQQLEQARKTVGVGLNDSPDGKGVVAFTVNPNGPAARAGLKPGMIIEAFNGQDTPDLVSLYTLWPADHRETLKLRVRDTEGRSRELQITPGMPVDFTPFLVKVLGTFYFLALIVMLLPQWNKPAARLLILLLALLSTEFLLPYYQIYDLDVNRVLWRINLYMLSMATVVELHFFLIFPRPLALYRRHHRLIRVLLYGLLLPAGLLFSATVDNPTDTDALRPYYHLEIAFKALIWLLVTLRSLADPDAEQRRLMRTVWLFLTPYFLYSLSLFISLYYWIVPWIDGTNTVELMLLALFPTGIFISMVRYRYLYLGRRLDSRLLNQFLTLIGFLLILVFTQKTYLWLNQRFDGDPAFALTALPALMLAAFLRPASQRLTSWLERGVFAPPRGLHQRFRGWMAQLPETEALPLRLERAADFLQQNLQIGWCGLYTAPDSTGADSHLLLRGGTSFPPDAVAELERQLHGCLFHDSSLPADEARRSGIHHILPLSHEPGNTGLLIVGETASQPARLNEQEWRDLQLIAEDIGSWLHHDRLERQALVDTLTGLMRREAFMEALLRLIGEHRAQGTSLALAMIDLDHFKRINDRWGHDAGDEVLRAIAQHIHSGVRSHDICGRYGGEEFIIAFPESNLQQVEKLLERLRDTIRDHPVQPVESESSVITISAGCVACTPANSAMEPVFLAREMIRQADILLYRAKHSGRDAAFIGRLKPAGSST